MATFEVGDIVTADSLNDIAETPLVKLIQQTTQSLADTTETNITFGAGSTDTDTHEFHDETTNNTRITPTKAGYYRVTGTLFMAASASYTVLSLVIRKNGSPQAPRARTNPAAVNSTKAIYVETVLSANGSTDYFELTGYQDSGGSKSTFAGTEYSSVFTCEYLRPL